MFNLEKPALCFLGSLLWFNRYNEDEFYTLVTGKGGNENKIICMQVKKRRRRTLNCTETYYDVGIPERPKRNIRGLANFNLFLFCTQMQWWRMFIVHNIAPIMLYCMNLTATVFSFKKFLHVAFWVSKKKKKRTSSYCNSGVYPVTLELWCLVPLINVFFSF